jgi:hypothetical protein
MEALNHVHVGAANGVERSHFVFAILERPLFKRGKLLSQGARDPSTEIRRCLQRKQLQAIALRRF